MTLPHSPSCERNKGPIWEVLSLYVDQFENVLEVGSGTGQHAVYFCQQHSAINWQPTNLEPYVDDCEQWRKAHGLANLKPCLALDVNRIPWPLDSTYSALYTANTFHIMSPVEVESFWRQAPKHLKEESIVIVYGPFNYEGKFTSPSNEAFDQRLKAEVPYRGIRDIAWVAELASKEGFVLFKDYDMPANNRLLVFKS